MQTFKHCWKMLDILILIAFYGTLVVILAWGQAVSVSPYRTRKPNTPLSNEEQVWDVRGIGIWEPEKYLKWRSSFCLTLETVFKAMSPSLDPGTVWSNSAELRKFIDCGREMPRPAGRHLLGRALKVHRISGGSWSLFQRYFKRLYHLRFDALLSFIYENGYPTAFWRSIHFRGSSAEVVPGRPGHFSTTAHGARKVLHCRFQLFQDELNTKVYPKLYRQLELFFRIPNSNVTDTCSSFLSGVSCAVGWP